MAFYLSLFLLLASSLSFFAQSRPMGTKGVNEAKIIELGYSMESNRIDPSRVIQLSWRPRVFLYRGFLSYQECDYLISLGHEKREKASVKLENLPTYSNVSLDTKDEVIARIEERISAWTFLPKENGNSIQVRHFAAEMVKQNYKYFNNTSKSQSGEPVIATVVLYLSNVSYGGQILFPESELISQSKNKVWLDCTRSSETLRPTKGNAILFFSRQLNAAPDPSSSHARCPVFRGEMWCATKQFYVKKISSNKNEDDNECVDMDENCSRWALIGECQKNPVFMVGSPDYYGTCRKSCKVC